ncbi:MAG: ATP-binding domain-containing protein [Pseudohongiella sp.]|nr:ATP-binding domain-containing protein [Pseudohongiella sp.]
MTELDLSPLADEALATFAEIASMAAAKLSTTTQADLDSFASGNTLTGATAYKNLAGIHQSQREALEKLRQEPAILRLVLEDDQDKQRIIYIGRNSNLALASGKEFASYRSPIGRLAEVPPGDEAHASVGGHDRRYWVIDKISFRPINETGEWDSRPSQYRHYDKGAYSIESLRALLSADGVDGADELDRLLEQARVRSGVSTGISHEVRTAMGLRDQPILDRFQGEIFRLPLSEQLIILGPPGTGKTTTLIKRLGQKLDADSLDQDEKRIAETDAGYRPHSQSWLMFTPSELLKHYLKEAFNREQVPASDKHIRTWASFRNDESRNKLGILRTVNGGKFTLKNDLAVIRPAFYEDASVWFNAFRAFHEERLRQQLIDGMTIVSAAASVPQQLIKEKLTKITDALVSRSLLETYRLLDGEDEEFKQALSSAKTLADDLLIKERNRLFNSDKDSFKRLATHLETLQQDGETDDEEAFDDDEQDNTSAPSHNDIQVAVTAYLAALKALARNKYLKRSIPKGSRSGFIIQFLGQSIPSDEVLIEVGRHISFQNGLRRFIQCHKRYVNEVPNSYQRFRRDADALDTFYVSEPTNSAQIGGIELDAIMLLILQNARGLLSQTYVKRAIGEARFGYLANIAELFRNQIMVDEATDFSMLELACMENLTSLNTQSFFACGDFNQRITTTGIRNISQLDWISSALSVRRVQLVYRQSQKLNAFAEELLRLQGGDLTSRGQLPEESTHNGVDPVLCEHVSDEDAARWIAERIKEVEKSVQQLPTIAVLVNSEQDVRPTAERLSRYLADVNLNAVACEEGRALGEGTDVRVFDIQHIKGLEFEAVFFASIDGLAVQTPELFDRYLYVGATRAATYLGLVSNGELPPKIEGLRPLLQTSWL